MKYWQKKTKDLEILLIGLQSLIQSLNYSKRRKLDNNTVLNPPDISATSVSEVTGIPRATCIRKLEWLSKAKLVEKDPRSKRYNLVNNEYDQDNLIDHPLTNVKEEEKRSKRQNIVISAAALSAVAVFGIILTL